jgi:hypothetical protein
MLLVRASVFKPPIVANNVRVECEEERKEEVEVSLKSAKLGKNARKKLSRKEGVSRGASEEVI